jgi:hypothetical protein
MSTHLLGFSLLAWVLANLCVSLLMTGVIWFVQIVHYPLFAKVGTGEFIAYERNHADRTGYVVAPPMIFELGASFVLCALLWHSPHSALGIAALARSRYSFGSQPSLCRYPVTIGLGRASTRPFICGS